MKNNCYRFYAFAPFLLFTVIFQEVVAGERTSEEPPEFRIARAVLKLSQAYADKGGKIAVILSSYGEIRNTALLEELLVADLETFKANLGNKEEALRLGESMGLKVLESKGKGLNDWALITSKEADPKKIPTEIHIEAFEKKDVSPYTILSEIILRKKIPVQIEARSSPRSIMEKCDFKWSGGTFGDLVSALCDKLGANMWSFAPRLSIASDDSRSVALADGVISGIISIYAKRRL